MQLQQLRYLIASAECGSFRSAAQKLYISQSSLSSAIKDLEQEMDVTIFVRTSRGLILTNDGVELISYARRVIEQADLMLLRYGRHSSGARVRFGISAQHYSLAVDAFGDFLEAHHEPSCEYSLHETYANEVIRDVRDGRSDLGIIYLSNYNDRVINRALESAGLSFVSLFVARPHVFVREGHRLAHKDMVSLDDFAGEYRFEHEQGIESSTYYAEEPLASMPHERTVVVSDNGTMVNLLSAHDGYTVATGVFPTGHGVVSVPIDTDEHMNVGYLVRTNQVMKDMVLEYLRFLAQRILSYKGTIELSSAVFKLAQSAEASE